MATALPNPSPDAKPPVLNCWKEIAGYLGRGVRTVQRYERVFHLPVRRLGGRTCTAVPAIPEDLDARLRTERCHILARDVRISVLQGSDLRRQCQELRAANRRAVDNLVNNLSVLLTEIQAGRVRGG